MLRSLIAHVFFLFATVAIALTSAQSAHAEMPFEFALWLNVATDSLDHQIDQEMQLQRQTLDLVFQRTAEGVERLMDQCRTGVGGRRGLQLVRVIDLLVELGDSGVAGVVAPAKNWNFPEENYEFRRRRVVQGNVQPRPKSKAVVSPIAENFSVALGHGGLAQRFDDTLARLATRAREEMDRFEEAVYRPAEPLVQVASRAWGKLVAGSAGQNRAEVSVSGEATPNKSMLSDGFSAFKIGELMSYWVEVSNSAQAKLNWLTSKVRHIAEAYLESIEPQFLILQLDPMA